MKFEAKYPDVPHGWQTPKGSSDTGMFVCRTSPGGRCWHCDEITPWIDMGFEANLCSEECYRAKWAEFQEAYNQASIKYGPPT